MAPLSKHALLRETFLSLIFLLCFVFVFLWNEFRGNTEFRPIIYLPRAGSTSDWLHWWPYRRWIPPSRHFWLSAPITWDGYLKLAPLVYQGVVRGPPELPIVVNLVGLGVEHVLNRVFCFHRLNWLSWVWWGRIQVQWAVFVLLLSRLPGKSNLLVQKIWSCLPVTWMTCKHRPWRLKGKPAIRKSSITVFQEQSKYLALHKSLPITR